MGYFMTQIAVIGLGYVGLPLAIEFGKIFTTIGYDISDSKITSYKNKIDPSGEVSSDEFELATQLQFTTDITKIQSADFIIIAMPTPVDDQNNPDFECLISASTEVGKNMKPRSTVIYESTVYPGATEEICIPVLEQYSGLKWKQDFNIGYSPERINPGDKVRTLTTIKKVVSGDTEASLEAIATLYEQIITAGVFKASSIRVAEAAKVIENIQRDVNISLMNELAMIFNKIGIDTNEVIDAASSKWNFINYRPGLVGGHCIGVDPYYMIQKAKDVGYECQIISNARKVNNGMSKFIVDEALKHFPGKKNLHVGILGLTFKEDCKDMRNSKVEDLFGLFSLSSKISRITIHDDVATPIDVINSYDVEAIKFENIEVCDILVLAVPHEELVNKQSAEYIAKLTDSGLMIDVKGRLNRNDFEITGKKYLSL